MKGLLKKDLALLANTGKIYVGVSLFCMVLGLVNEDMRDFSLSFLVIMFSLCRSELVLHGAGTGQ